MTFRPIPSPLAGEHVLAVAPRPAYPSVDAGWRRRTRMFAGRALDDQALSREQEARAGQLALLGQTLAPGVVVGLEVGFEATASGDFLRVAPGIGLVASGEDVVLGREVRVRLADLLDAVAAPPLAAILTLAPVVRWVRGRFDAGDPCERDEAEDAFADERWVDGVELVLLPWDPAWGALTTTTAHRNPLAYRVFDAERGLGAGEVAPWQDGAVPLALIGLNGRRVAWLDRAAVVRAGGHAPPRTPLVVPPSLRAGTRALWQAQIEQLVEHLDGAAGGGPVPSALALGLGRLPPAGVVPRTAMDVAPLANHFFPSSWRLRAAPIPREQLDDVLARAAGLAPLSTAISEEVLVLVPVPQSVYEPELLIHDSIPDPLFGEEIARLVVERTESLGRREYLRDRRDAVLGAIDKLLVVPDPEADPTRIEDEAAVAPNGTGEDAFDIIADGGTLRPKVVMELKSRLDKPAPGSTTPLLGAAERAQLYNEGLVPLIDALEQKLKRADDTIDFGFLKAQTNIYRLRQYMLGNTLATRLATSPVLATIAKGETSGAVRDDLTKLYVNLQGPPPGATRPPIESVAGLRSITSITSAFESAATLESPLLTGIGAGGMTADDVRDSTAVTGGDDFRNVTIAERLAPAAATEVRASAKATNYGNVQTLVGLADLGLNLADLPIHGFAEGKDRVSKRFGELKPETLEGLLGDPEPEENADEASFFHDATRVIEGHVATMRNLEGRVAQYRVILRYCRTVLAQVRALEAKIAARMAVVVDELTERRQAVATAKALLAEEVARLARIVARRQAVLAQHVRELAYVRPRYFDGLTAVPSLSLDPGLLESPVPACLSGHADAPAELDDLVNLLREAPLAWLRHAGPALDHLDRVELLHRLVVTSRTRVQAMTQVGFAAPWTVQQPAGRFGKVLAAVGRAQVDAIWQPRSLVADLDLRKLVGLSWIESRDAVRQVVSLGDLIEGGHGRSAAAAAALAELQRINQVSACLWARLGDVEPVIRLGWADALSQYEPGRSLRSLSVLPRWRDVDFRLRKDLEVLAEWLMDRVDPARPDAIAWMLDLVRTAILLASHAPVDEIIAGHVPTEAAAHPGALVPVAIDPSRVRIGMHVTFFHGGQAISRGVVEDLVGDRARARIAESIRDDLRLDTTVRAQFTSQVKLLGGR
jgi:hypothetical protein